MSALGYSRIAPNFLYGNFCFSSDPCRHHMILYGKETEYASALTIIKECKKRKIKIPSHFRRYSQNKL